LIVKHAEDQLAARAATDLAHLLKSKYGHGRILGPEKPLIERIRNLYAQEILIKLEKGISLSKFKNSLRQDVEEAQSWKSFKGVQLVIDVDCN
jgi:primosomal protein N' (replication factor Y)